MSGIGHRRRIDLGYGFFLGVFLAGRGDRSGKATTYYGRDGVIEITPDRNMVWDGLWHSRLAQQDDYVGTNNWLMAAIPFICHQGEGVPDTLVVGMGTGITAAVLAESPQVKRVDTYEINTTIQHLLRDYPEGTLHVAENPKIDILWQDGRSGLALNPRQYDLITSAPLYLKQAGSSLLLSREYFELAKQRLKPGGVFAIYSNSMGNAEQALLVRQTIASVFRYYESFDKGYLLAASSEPIVFSVKNLERFASTDPLAKQILRFSAEKMQSMHDQPPLPWETTPHVITDNHPLLEYPNVVKSVFSSWREKQSLVTTPVNFGQE